MTPPYESIRGLRSAEHCKVTSLEYFLATPPTITRNGSAQQTRHKMIQGLHIHPIYIY